MMSYLEDRQKMVTGGFSEDEISQWTNDKRKKLVDAGFPSNEIDAYFGATPQEPLVQEPASSLTVTGVVPQENVSDTPLEVPSQLTVTEVVQDKTQTDMLSSTVDLATSTARLAKDMAVNLPASTFNILNDIGVALMSPVTSANTIGEIILGGIQKVPGLVVDDFPIISENAERTFDALAESFRTRYGSLEELNKTMANDPAGVLLDFSFLMTVGGTALAQVPKTAAYGNALLKTAEMIDPLVATGRAASKTTTKLGEGVGKALGELTTAEIPAIREAFKGTGLTAETNPFLKGMRGKINQEDLVTSMTDTVKSIREQRGQTYRQQLQELTQNTTPIDIRPVKNRLSELMSKDKYNIGVNPNGTLDFSRSSIQRSERTKVQEIVNDINSWGSKVGDDTAVGLDILKRKLDNFYSENANTRAFVASLSSEVKKTIVNQVPEYATMTATYEKTTRLINDLEKSLSLGKKASMDQTLRKITASMKDDFDFRRTLLDEIEKVSGESLKAQIAGIIMQDIVPKRLIGGLAIAGAIKINPWMMTITAATSPRTMGEFLNAAGFAKNQVDKAIRVLEKAGAFDPKLRKAAALVGRTEDDSKQPGDDIQWNQPITETSTLR